MNLESCKLKGQMMQEAIKKLNQLKNYIGEIVGAQFDKVADGHIDKTHILVLTPIGTLICIEQELWDGTGKIITQLRRDEIREGLTTQSWDRVIEKAATALEKNNLYEKVVKPFSLKQQLPLF